MRRDTHAFLERVRDAENPSHADEERVLRALQASLAAGIAPSISGKQGFGKTWLGKTASALGSFGSKLSLVAAFTATGLGAADTAQSPRPPGLTRAAGVERAASNAERGRQAPPRVELAPETREPALEPASSTMLPVPAKPRQGEHRASTLTAELTVLRTVQAALRRGDGTNALRALDAQRPRDSRLLAERRAARILALCLLGRVAEARREARDFSSRHADSVQREAIAKSCAGPQRIRTR